MAISLKLPSLGDLPPVTRAMTVLFFAGWLAELAFGYRLNDLFGLVPAALIYRFWLWQAATYIFIHANFWHFFFNAFMMWMLGCMLEPEMGSRKFLLYFLVCGIAAALFTAAWTPNSPIPVVGASGAVYGLLGAFAFLHPETRVYLYFVFPMSARTLAFLLGALEFVMTLSRTGSTISSATHLGGLAAGLLWLWAERRFKGRPARETDTAAMEMGELDHLLEKISRKGQSALSRSEIARLDEYARKRGGRA